MKVMCIKESTSRCDLAILMGVKPIVSVGEIYTVVDEGWQRGGRYYELSEHLGALYLTELFAPLSDIDETELIKQNSTNEINHPPCYSLI